MAVLQALGRSAVCAWAMQMSYPRRKGPAVPFIILFHKRIALVYLALLGPRLAQQPAVHYVMAVTANG